MTPQEFMLNFGTLADAPGGVGRLRDLVLELAVLGRLPVSRSKDNAEVQVRASREMLAKKGNGRGRPSDDSDVTREGQPPIPTHWAWARLGTLGEIVSGTTKGRDLRGRKVASYPYLRVANVQRGFLDLNVMKEIEIPVEELDKYRLLPGDVLFTEGGDWDKLGRSVVWNGEINPCIHQNHVFRARLALPALEPRWVSMYSNSPVGRAYFMDAAKQTTNLASINATQLRACPIPVPPLAEQRRIVAKVDQLMALLDDLQAKQGNRLRTVTRATTACLDALTPADTPEEVNDAWKRVAGNWRVLFDRPEAVNKARTAILALSIRGLLTGGAGSAGGGEDVLPPLPTDWCWRKVEDVGELKLGRQRSPKNHNGPHMRKYLRVANVFEARIDTSDILEMNFDPEEAKRFALAPNDILLNEGQSTELVGRPAIYRGEVPGACFQNTLIRFRPHDYLTSEYALIVFRAYMRIGRFVSEAQQTTNMAHLSLGRLAVIEFPLPPLAEQKRIVARVDQLMALCDDLEANLRRRDDRAGKLVAAVVGEMVSS
jgi:type I restriction enzyme S subunit